MKKIFLGGLVLLLSICAMAQEKKAEPPQVDGVKIQLATFPALSPDGKKLAFSWAGDIWISDSKGGEAHQLTANESSDSEPMFSPDGKRIAFTSTRTGSNQVWVMPLAGGVPKQVTFHSEGSRIQDWYPDGKSILVAGARDFATKSASRFFRINLEKRESESLLFNAEGTSPSLSPDGKRLLFCREGNELYRKGYRGSRVSQIWLAENLETGKPKFTRIIARDTGARSPKWKPDGKGFYYLGDHGPGERFDVWEWDFETKKEKQHTDFKEDSAILPGIARSGSAMVFRNGFEFVLLDLSGKQEGESLHKVKLKTTADAMPDFTIRRTLTKTNNISFAQDGLEVAFVAGGDLWVMDTVLREPVAILSSPDESREPVFSADGKEIFFIRDSGVSSDIWSAKRKDEKAYWWENEEFTLTNLSKSNDDKNDLQAVPGGEKISWISGRGDLWVAKRDGKEAKRLLKSWNQPEYDWSPDGKWIAWAVEDNNFNRDIWISNSEGKPGPYNLSRHPDTDRNPRWSPDGKMLAFTGRHEEKETDIFYVYLNRTDEEKDRRDRKIEEAREKMEKARKPSGAKPVPKPEAKSAPKGNKPAEPKLTPKAEPKAEEEPVAKADEPEKKAPSEPASKTASAKPKLPKVAIDFDGLYERIHQVKIDDTTETGLFWTHDSKRLGFSAEIKGVKATYTVSFPDKLTPVRFSSKQGAFVRSIAKDDSLLWLVDGVPALYSRSKHYSYSFSVRQEYDRRDYWENGFQQAWRIMRDNWYDENLNNLDWDAVRQKYEGAASSAVDSGSFVRAVSMMLGELNGSHTGYKAYPAKKSTPPSRGWTEETGHLGVQYERDYHGPGLKVSYVIPRGPTDQLDSRLKVGDVILSIDGVEIDSKTDLTEILTDDPNRNVELNVSRPAEKDEKRKKDTLTVRPFNYSKARELLAKDHIQKTRDLVEKASNGRVGYVFVPRMGWDEFIQFEAELFACGVGKEGLIIDVRNNGGGFTTDHLLTALTPPQHAITVPRAGSPGYPQDRRVYATWAKPITVLCNQNSFSNAEIFSHSIKEVKRGKLVGVPTTGGVISTGSATVRDMGTLRLPFRGWYRKSDGADLEMNGAVPDFVVWPKPEDHAAGVDRQVNKAVSVLLEEINANKAKPKPSLVPKSERK